MATISKSAATQKPPITAEEWAKLEGPPHYDLVDGQLREKPDVAVWHEVLLIQLIGFFYPYISANRLGSLVCSTAKLKISAASGRQPDLFLIPNDQLHLARKNLFKGVPPFALEVLSPSNERTDRVEKKREYAQLGIGHYWIVDFPNRRIEVYQLQTRPESNEYELVETIAGDAIFRPGLFPGLEIPLGEIWPTEFENLPEDDE